MSVLITVAGILRLLSIVVVVLLLAAAGFTWNEARKEVVFLCSNFSPGVTEESVVRQLDTGHFLRYRRESTRLGKTIVVDSAYNFGVYACIIDLDADGTVTRARVE